MTSILAPEPQRKTRIDLLAKLARRMLDPAASDGEAVNSAEKFARIARIDGVSFNDLGEIFMLPDSAQTRRPAACGIVVHFGKHAGESLLDIGLANLGYLQWLSVEAKNDDLRDAASVVLDWITGGEE